jgi:NAD(P)-dependent dehydrogenase (short-subunit alcohol dehydrogenase family)
LELDGQVAIVTGAGRGIGRAIALELATLGARLIVAELDSTTGEQSASAVRALGREAVALTVDVTRRDDLARMVATALETFGRLDILVNNAGVFRAAPMPAIDDEHWDRVMDINAKAVFFACQVALPHMQAAGRGSIVNIASMAGKIGTPASLVYGASKAAVISLTRSLALAVAADGVRVNCVCPGFVETEMWSQLEQEMSAIQGITQAEFHARSLARIPLGRWETPEDVARVVGFLASERSGYITGEALNVSGGLVMQ